MSYVCPPPLTLQQCAFLHDHDQTHNHYNTIPVPYNLIRWWYIYTMTTIWHGWSKRSTCTHLIDLSTVFRGTWVLSSGVYRLTLGPNYKVELAIRERKLASRILTDIQDPGLVNGKLASRIFRIQDL